jgi:hypothetical protein
MITIADLKAHLNLSGEDDDALLSQKLAAAEAWTAGYIGLALADLDPFPADVGEAILRIAADLYENREATLVGVSASALPFGVTDLLAAHREWAF